MVSKSKSHPRVLIIAADFAPSAVVGAKRPTVFAAELSQRGHDVYVVTMREECYERIDPSVGLYGISEDAIVRVPCCSLWRHSRWNRRRSHISKIWNKAVRGIASITQPLLLTDVAFPWGLSALKRTEQLVQQSAIDVIWATIPELSAAYLAMCVSERTGVPYVVDVRDVPNIQPGCRRYWCLRRIFENCAGITYVAPRQEQALIDLCGVSHEMPRVLVHNSLPIVTQSDTHNEWKPVTPPYIVLHGGALYGGERDITGVMKAVRLINEHDNIKVRFDVYADASEHPRLLRVAREIRCGDCVGISEALPHVEFLQRCRDAHALILAVGHSRLHTDTIPAKLYDYFGVNVPILVVGSKDSTSAQLVSDLKRGVVADDSKPAEIREAILQLLSGKGELGVPLELNSGSVSQFSRKQLAGVLSGFLGNVSQHTSELFDRRGDVAMVRVPSQPD
ncbi:MAG: glycosyltransferase [Pirellulaceae bacterium]|nr:hypothetical protein [Planctomycetales bacterium]